MYKVTCEDNKSKDTFFFEMIVSILHSRCTYIPIKGKKMRGGGAETYPSRFA